MSAPAPAPAAGSVSWFEIGAPDVDAAMAFYGPLFGWSFAPDGSYTLGRRADLGARGQVASPGGFRRSGLRGL